jgi:hypothetical protein
VGGKRRRAFIYRWGACGMELWRRIILIICISAGMGMAYLACLDPVVIVKAYEEKRVKAHTPLYPPHVSGGDAFAGPLLSPEDQAVIKIKRQPEVLKVEGKAWMDFFQRVTATLEGSEGGTEWAGRFPSGRHPMKALFFRPDEHPLDTLPAIFTRKANRLYLMRDNDGTPPQYLEVDYRQYSDRDFRLGSGFSQYPEPPVSFLYPYRPMGLLIILAGVAFYLFLPRPGKRPGALCYDWWRVVLSDFLGVMFYLISIAVPIVAVGGTLQIFPEGFIIFLFVSPFFVGGMVILWICAWYGSYQILPAEEGIRITTFRGTRLYHYEDMNFFQPVVFMPPQWLIAASWMAVFASAGAARLGAAGRAFMLSSSSAGSIGIGLRNKAMLFVNVTDQMGGTSLKGFEQIVETLKRRRVRERRDAKTIRSLGLETLRFEVPEK